MQVLGTKFTELSLNPDFVSSLKSQTMQIIEKKDFQKHAPGFTTLKYNLDENNEENNDDNDDTSQNSGNEKIVKVDVPQPTIVC